MERDTLIVILGASGAALTIATMLLFWADAVRGARDFKRAYDRWQRTGVIR